MGIADTAGGNDGVLSMTNLKDPLNPEWADDEAMKLYMEKVEQYSPDAEVDNAIVALRLDPGRPAGRGHEDREDGHPGSGVMDAVRNMDGLTGGLLLPDVTITTGPDDPYMGETVTLMQYDLAKKYFELIGEPIDFEGKTADFTPENLITG